MFGKIAPEPGPPVPITIGRVRCSNQLGADSYLQPKITVTVILKDCKNRKICEVGRNNFLLYFRGKLPLLDTIKNNADFYGCAESADTE